MLLAHTSICFAQIVPDTVIVPIGPKLKAQLEVIGCNTNGLPDSVTVPINDELRHAFEAMRDEHMPQKFVPTLESVRAYYARQHIPDILELGPEATPNGCYFVVERDAPEWSKKAVDKMYPAAVGTRWNNLLFAADGNSASLRNVWYRRPGDALIEQKSGRNLLTLENVRAYFASTDRGMGVGPDDIIALGHEVRLGMYPVLLRNMEDWHVANVRMRHPDLPVGYNNYLLTSECGLMVIRYVC